MRKSNLTIEKAKAEHGLLMAMAMREEDRREVQLFHARVENAIERSLSGAAEAYSIFDAGGEILAMVGVTPYTLTSSVAAPWLVTGKGVERHKKLFLQATRELVSRWSEEYSVLENYMDARYKKAIRWAKWAGFTVDPPERYGYLGIELCRIHIGNE